MFLIAAIVTNNKNTFLSHILSVPPSPVEHVFVIVKINLTYNIIRNAYFPPRTDISIYNMHFDIINSLLLSLLYVKKYNNGYVKPLKNCVFLSK